MAWQLGFAQSGTSVPLAPEVVLHSAESPNDCSAHPNACSSAAKHKLVVRRRIPRVETLRRILPTGHTKKECGTVR